MLTEKQHKLLSYLSECQRTHGICPSYDDMCRAIGIKSKSGIHALVKALVERGYCRRLPNRARAIEVVRDPLGPSFQDLMGDNVKSTTLGFQEGAGANQDVPPPGAMTTLPLYGEIAAGLPIEAFQNPDQTIEVPTHTLGPDVLLNPHDFFALVIVGDSMKEAGILDQDIVILKRCSDAPVGAIVAALIDEEEVTLKRLAYEGGSIVLEPANRDYVATVLEPDRVKIQGRLAHLIRKYV